MKKITGLAVNRGNVRGQVIKLDPSAQSPKSDSDFSGKILVARAITPDIIFYIGKIVGIIAETGGITSHAAIIALEFGVPCIVSAANCTEVLKDGDEIILNGEEGTVYVLN